MSVWRTSKALLYIFIIYVISAKSWRGAVEMGYLSQNVLQRGGNNRKKVLPPHPEGRSCGNAVFRRRNKISVGQCAARTSAAMASDRGPRVFSDPPGPPPRFLQKPPQNSLLCPGSHADPNVPHTQKRVHS